MNLPDVQNRHDERGIKIDWVGVEGYKIPFSVQTKDGKVQSTVGSVTIMTGLSEKIKGANMSRYSSVIETALEKGLLSTELLSDMLVACRDQLESESSYIIISFDYFIKKKAPHTGKVSHFVVPCNFCGVLENGVSRLYLECDISYTSLCPCSREMSEVSAHNQRSNAIVRVKLKERYTDTFWIEDLVEIVERCGSCAIYNLLKRPDEKYVTDAMYEKAAFVEDVVRDIALNLDRENLVDGYRIKVIHHESIHQHCAVAKIKKNL